MSIPLTEIMFPCIPVTSTIGKTNRIGSNRGTSTEYPHLLFLVGRFLNEITGIKNRAFMKMKYHDYLLALPYILPYLRSISIEKIILSLCIRDAPVPRYVCLLIFATNPIGSNSMFIK